MDIATAYYGATGRDYRNCYFLSQRFVKDWGYKPREADTMLVCLRNTVLDITESHVPFRTSSWLTSAWASGTGALYVADAFKQVLVNRQLVNDIHLGPDSFETHPVEASLHGIWGVSDECVFTWGARFDKGAFNYPVFQWNGKLWLMHQV